LDLARRDIANAGTYVLVFGVTNANDTAYDSGLATSGVQVCNGTTCQGVGTNATPLPAALPLFAGGLGAMGLLGWRRKRKKAAAIAVRSDFGETAWHADCVRTARVRYSRPHQQRCGLFS
jgi:hypothetical protein